MLFRSDACWKGYTAVGTKKKNGRTVPNCVPEETSISEDGAAVVAAGPTNVVGGGAIAGTGGRGGEPGVNMKKKKGPVLLQDIGKRKPPKM